MKIVFSHALGTFVYDEHLNLVSHEKNNLNQSLRFVQELASGIDPFREAKLKKTDGRDPTPSEERKIRMSLATLDNHKELRDIALRITKDKLKAPVQPDILIMTVVGNIEEITKAANTLSKKAREWNGWYIPEAGRLISDHEAFIKVSQSPKAKIISDLALQESVGADIEEHDEKAMHTFFAAISALYQEKRQLETYLDELMHKHCPNMTAVAGVPIGAKLIKEAGSLRRMAMATSTMIQMLGAEKALFRHLRNKKVPPPKHGHIINHPLLLKASAKDKGKVARALADKISIAIRVDYFHGQFVGDSLRRELEEKFV